MGTVGSVCGAAGWASGVGRKPRPALGPALGKQASLCPDSLCLTIVCCGTGHGPRIP